MRDRRPGRPPKPPHLVRSQWLPVRFSPEDLACIRNSARSRGYTVTEWARGRLHLGWSAHGNRKVHPSDTLGFDSRHPKRDPWPGDVWKRGKGPAEFGRIIQVRGVTHKGDGRVAFCSLDSGDPLIDVTMERWISIVEHYHLWWLAQGRRTP